MKPWRVRSALVCGLLIAGAAHVGAQSAPPMPQRLVDYCEGESCQYGCRAIVQRPLALRSADSRTAPISAQLRVGDTVVISTGNLWLLEPGLVLVVRDTVLKTDDGAPRTDTLALVRGDSVHVLEYHELGYWAWWARGRRYSGFEFWSGERRTALGSDRDSLAAVLVRDSRIEYWFQLRGSRGTGWWLAVPGYVSLLDDWMYCVGPPRPPDGN